MKNDPAKIRLILRLFVPHERPFHMLVHGHRIVQDGEHFHVIIMIMGQHLVDIFLHPGNLSPIVLQVIIDHRKRLSKIALLRLP